MTNDRERFTSGSDAEWIRRLREENERLRAELTRREREAEDPATTTQAPGAPDRRPGTQNERQKREIDHLKQQLAAARRAGFRQAAPFAKNRPKGRGGPFRPPRRCGLWPESAPASSDPCRRDVCGAGPGVVSGLRRRRRSGGHRGAVSARPCLWVRPVVRRFEVEIGHCSQCRRRLQGRHALQTSDALGAAGAQLGPGVAALVVELHTELGMPLGKVARFLRTTFGLSVTPGGLAHLLHRTARDAAPAYAALCQQVRESDVVTPDETGWRVGALRHWLWVFATPETNRR